MNRLAPMAVAALCLPAVPLAAQSMPGMHMPGMPAAPHKRERAPRGAVTKPPTAGISETAHSHPSTPPAAQPPGTPGMAPGAMARMDMADTADSHPITIGAPAGTDLPAGHAAAPAMPADHYADRFFATGEMDEARAAMMHENGGQAVHQLLFNLAEIEALQGHFGYRWDGEGFIGGDVDRLWLKSEGDGTVHQGVASAEAQALFSHAIGPYYNLQVGVRQDIRSGPGRTYATIGFEGLSPYAFETEGALFLSDKGDLLARLEAWHDARITQRLVLQPRIELNMAAQDVPADRYGAGLVDAELGLRLRYEVRRAFAPYVGVSWAQMTGRTADYARADRQSPGGTSFVMGVRTWL